MGARRIRREQRRVDQAESRLLNGVRKVKERERRDARMLATIKASKMPYGPQVMSWLSVRLNKPTTRITQEDVDRVAQQATKA
ncbi:MAG: hypothetical protein L0Z62_51195 [Gemmataceae bacterium]|nr:hypothetical protein [Gemmataceae bacterium]